MLGFKQSYHVSPIEQHQQALSANVQDDIMLEADFKSLIDKLMITDSGMEVIFAMSLIDCKVKRMTEHNAENYQELLGDAVSALTVLNDEIDYIVDIADEDLTVHEVMQPILAATTFLIGKPPTVRFCEDREDKELMTRVEELIDSFHNTIKKSEEHNRQLH